MRTKTCTVRTCLYFNECGKKEVHNGKRWKEQWCRYKDDYLCKTHYSRLIDNKNRPKSRIKKYNDRRITFLGKHIHLSWKIRTGFCSLCYNNIYDNTCERTNMHHWFYVPIMIWSCTEERCTSCHNIETNKYIKENGLVKGHK